MGVANHLLFVIKTSKYCNLRCDYCYEFPYLGDKARMSLDQVSAAFTNIKSSASALGIETVELIWHGGEPLLIPLEFYENVGAIEQKIFGSDLQYVNKLQTNLTVLTDRHIEFVKGDFFSGVGVSFDVYGGLRVDTRGKLRDATVLANLHKLLECGVDVGAIAVLARDTLPKVREIYQFYDELNIHHRLLSYYKSASGTQDKRHGLDFDELIGAYKTVFHEWLASERATPVDPIAQYVSYATRYITGNSNFRFDRSRNERVLIIDVNGGVFSDSDSYEQQFCYGNIFNSPLSEIIASDTRSRILEPVDDRVRRFCRDCPYFGSCPGLYVAEATGVQREWLETHGCPERAMIDYVIDVFARTELKSSILENYKKGSEDAAQSDSVLNVA